MKKRLYFGTGPMLADGLRRIGPVRCSEIVVFAMPRGGVPVAIEVAGKLGAQVFRTSSCTAVQVKALCCPPRFNFPEPVE